MGSYDGDGSSSLGSIPRYPKEIQMTPEIIFHAIEIVVLGAPLWWGVLRVAVILREFPPHRHINGSTIVYPHGMEPGEAVKTKFQA